MRLRLLQPAILSRGPGSSATLEKVPSVPAFFCRRTRPMPAPASRASACPSWLPRSKSERLWCSRLPTWRVLAAVGLALKVGLSEKVGLGVALLLGVGLGVRVGLSEKVGLLLRVGLSVGLTVGLELSLEVGVGLTTWLGVAVGKLPTSRTL